MSEQSAGLGELVERLSWPDAGARRVAILDLISLSKVEPRATPALVRRLPHEQDERAAILMIRHLAASGFVEARPLLMSLYESRNTPVAIAHAAINAHDAMGR